MKLHPAVVSQADIYSEVAAALVQPSTVVFADTSILFWLFRLSRAARDEFVAWVSGDLAGRFFIPVWSAHELHGYLEKGQAALTPLTAAIKTVENDIAEAKALVSLLADDSTSRAEYPDRQAYLAAVDQTGRDFISLCQLAGGRIAWQELAREITPFINEHLMSSNIFPVLRWMKDDFAARVEGRVPPGFKDDKTKRDNRFGDLMIWNEIVSFCQANSTFNRALLLTNDNKIDWVYRPDGVFNALGDRTNNQGSHETLLSAPLLAHELSTVSSVNDFNLLNATG